MVSLAAGLALSHAIIVIGAGHGAGPLGLIYGFAVAGELSYGPSAHSPSFVLTGGAGLIGCALAPLLPHASLRRIALALSAACLAIATAYFYFSVTETKPFTGVTCVPFLAAVLALSVWLSLSLWRQPK